MVSSRRLRLVSLAAAAVLLAAACDDGSGQNPGHGGDTGSAGGDVDNDLLEPGDVGVDGVDGAGDATVGDLSADGTEDMSCAVDRVCGSLCCAAGTYCINGACRDTCSTGITCGPTGGLCCGSTQVCRADETCGADCAADRVACGSGCCAAGQVCSDGQCVYDCPGGADPCNRVCCADDQMCHQGECVAQCADASKLCGEQSELCCGASELCLGGATCVTPGASCTLTEQCEIDEYCEPTIGACVPRSAVEVCEYRPPVGQFSPVAGCKWRPPADATRPAFNTSLPTLGTFGDVVMTPVVANVTDDNQDGVTDTLDTPDIIFTSFNYNAHGCCTPNGVIRIVSGACRPDGAMDTLYTFHGIPVDNSGGLAVANLHPDNMPGERAPEIVATTRTQGVFALRRTADDGSAWEVMWHNTNHPTPQQLESGGTPSIADLDGDGQPEVIIGNVVLDGLTGALLMDGSTLLDPATGMIGTGGQGHNAFLGPSSAVADIDLDGIQEIIAGNSVYEWNGTTARIECSYVFTTQNSSCAASGPRICDGFNAVGNFDADPEGEIVIVRRGQVFVLDHDCTEKHVVNVPRDSVQPYLGDGPCNANESGPPTVADFDGDGFPEIGTAGADFYVVVDLQCVGDPLPEGCFAEKIRWVVPNFDCSSRATASSVFDFEGDGRAEVVYADEQNFRVYDGVTGAVLFNDASHSSNTRIEMPVVVDVDNDGKSEIIVAKSTNNANDEGLTVWQDADNNWVRTRRIWNQHGYSVTNVTEDGQVPRNAAVNWLSTRLNNYRQNVQPGGLFDAPDLTIEDFAVSHAACSASTVRITITVANRGALGVPAGILVHATVTLDNGQTFDLGALSTSQPLLPGQTTQLHFDWVQPEIGSFTSFTVRASVDDDGTGVGQYNECDEANNAATSVDLLGCSIH